MKNNILKNVTLDPNEKVLKDFLKLRAKGSFCQIMLTDKRLIIYTFGIASNRGRRVRRKMMHETDLKAINQFEYYVDYYHNPVWARILGIILFVLGIAGAYAVYANLIAIPAYPYSQYGNYVIAALVAFIGLRLFFRLRKALSVKIKYGLNDIFTLYLKVTKYNELAVRYIASKIRVYS
ncbi:MAG: hypothetical protein GX904_01125 [Acholeplasmataceae bacterium]|nr:hypothetical protein [Acholeplasmataceae bacterium]